MTAELLQGRRLKATEAGVNGSPARLGALQAVAAVLASPLSLEGSPRSSRTPRPSSSTLRSSSSRSTSTTPATFAPSTRPGSPAARTARSQRSLRPGERPDRDRSAPRRQRLAAGRRSARRTADPASLCPRGLMVVGRVETRPFSDVDRAFASVLAGHLRAGARSPSPVGRARACAQAASPPAAPRRPPSTHLQVGDMDIDLVGQSVSIDGRAATLTHVRAAPPDVPGRGARAPTQQARDPAAPLAQRARRRRARL